MTDSTVTAMLHWAIRSKTKNEILNILSNVRQEDLKVTDQYGNTVLHLVLSNENLPKKEMMELLELFLDQGIDIHAENEKGKTVLHSAIQCRMKSVVDFLISRKADIDKRDCQGNSLTHDFIENEAEWFYESLERRKSRFQRMDNVVVEDESAKFSVKAFESVREGQENESASFTEFLIKRDFNFDLQNKKGTSALHLAIERNLKHILHVLVKHTRDIHFVDYRGKSLLQLFIEKKAECRVSRKNRLKNWYPEYALRYNAAIVRILLDRGVPTWPHDSDRHCTSLQTAIECQEDVSIVKMLIQHGLQSMEEYSATEVFVEWFKIYLRWGEMRTEYFLSGLRDLIARGADVNVTDKSGMTPLYHALHRKNLRAVHFLIDSQADLSATTNFDENLFHALARVEFSKRPRNNRVELEALFDVVARKGCCDVNARNTANETPLHLAARCKNLVIARKLLESGAEVNCKDVNGRTPLHHAVQHSEGEDMTKLLLETGADVNCKEYWGRRPLFIAVDEAVELVPLLLKWGAYVNAYNLEDLPFWKVILRDDYSIAKEMLAYGADINNNDDLVRSLFECSCSDSSSCEGPESLRRKKILLRHWIKLRVAKLPCSKEYKPHIKNDKCQKFYKDCMEEIKKLEHTFIDRRTSIYRFLHMNFGRRRKHMNSEKLQQLVQSPELKDQFPNYSVVILASYRQTVTWKSLLESAKIAWFKITGFRLPGECLEPIFARLGVVDLVNMIELDDEE